jgi:osmotically-inducible protein OsmY
VSRLKPIYTLAFASLLAGILAGCADFRQCKSQDCTADAKITTDTEARLNQMPELGPPGSIRVQTLDHVVYLNGQVDGGLEKRNAEATARQVPGVQLVANDIDVLHK